MKSSNGNIFRVIGHLCGELSGHRWIPRTKASDAELWCFRWSASWINVWVNNREAGDLRRHRAHYDIIVMISSSINFFRVPGISPVQWVNWFPKIRFFTCSYTTGVALTKCFPICSSLNVKAHLISFVAIHLVSQWIRARSFRFDTSISLMAAVWDKEVWGLAHIYTSPLIYWCVGVSIYGYGMCWYIKQFELHFRL